MKLRVSDLIAERIPLRIDLPEGWQVTYRREEAYTEDEDLFIATIAPCPPAEGEEVGPDLFIELMWMGERWDFNVIATDGHLEADNPYYLLAIADIIEKLRRAGYVSTGVPPRKPDPTIAATICHCAACEDFRAS